MLKAIEMKKGIYWVGAVDWSMRSFHGYSTRRGSSYNAYLILDEKITLYLATDLSEGNVNRDSDEFLTVRRIPLDVLGEWILAGKIPDGKTQAAISRVILMKEKGLL